MLWRAPCLDRFTSKPNFTLHCGTVADFTNNRGCDGALLRSRLGADAYRMMLLMLAAEFMLSKDMVKVDWIDSAVGIFSWFFFVPILIGSTGD